MAQRLKNIDLVRNCDAFPYKERNPDAYAAQMSQLYTLVYQDDTKGGEETPIGYMLPRVYHELAKVPVSIKGEMDVYPAQRKVSILRGVATEEERSAIIARLAQYWRQRETFTLLRSWRDELWPVYGSSGDDGEQQLLFNMERGALGLFGGMRFGVHMIAYVKDSKASHGLKIWVPTRAANKRTYPGMLDNTVAGGLMTAEDPLECVIREADEEASLSEAVVRGRAKETGIISYLFITDERSGGEPGYIYPEVQWVYDLELPADVLPAPLDGEVERFDLCTVEQVQEGLAAGLYKPNCAVVTLDFFIRHGILTRENEPDFDEIQQRMHRVMPFPGPHREYERRRAAAEGLAAQPKS